ncbi:hypothetical protein [Porphyrobacter sp. CACIAM 03H1]|uniref:hypothetical protein n=1 Tax=Porphyrobacter sp. CACIAM 03H1 TaxID=2003315 RepID=UPI0012FD8AEE|nr:hypothetical protein [Porphyrobacter sp. CACIAM 03H1]
MASTIITRIKETTRASGDRYEWKLKEPVQVAPGIRLTYGLDYTVPGGRKNWRGVALNEVAVDITFRFDAAEIGHELNPPPVSWLHLYRNWPSARDPGSSATSLVSQMLWDKFANGNASTRAVIALDDLLAFGSGRDALGWAMRSSPDTFGSSRLMFRGRLEIAQLQNKIGAIPDLRRQLQGKVATFETSCNLVAPASVP